MVAYRDGRSASESFPLDPRRRRSLGRTVVSDYFRSMDPVVEPVKAAYGAGSLDQIVPTLLHGRSAGLAPRTALRGHLRRAARPRRARLGERRAAPQPRCRSWARWRAARSRRCCPSTTAAALTSLATGMAPAQHGIVGFRMRVDDTVLNVLRWQVPYGRQRARSLLGAAAHGVPRPPGARPHQEGVPQDRLHRGAPARQPVPRVEHDVRAGRALPAAHRPRRTVRLRVLPGRRHASRTSSACTTTTTSPSSRSRTSWSAACSTRCRRTRRWSSPPTTGRCTSATTGSRCTRCARCSSSARGRGGSGTSTRTRVRRPSCSKPRATSSGTRRGSSPATSSSTRAGSARARSSPRSGAGSAT